MILAYLLNTIQKTTLFPSKKFLLHGLCIGIEWHRHKGQCISQYTEHWDSLTIDDVEAYPIADRCRYLHKKASKTPLIYLMIRK